MTGVHWGHFLHLSSSSLVGIAENGIAMVDPRVGVVRGVCELHHGGVVGTVAAVVVADAPQRWPWCGIFGCKEKKMIT